ncbi:hypothetical protein Hanom_Chr05g00423051 [Helianthus anomalus]
MSLSELPDLRWNHFRTVVGFRSLMAMAMSFGKRSLITKACRIVVMSKPKTVRVAITERVTDKILVKVFVTSFVYRIVAIAAPVIGKVYAHQANENVNPLKKFTRTAC